MAYAQDSVDPASVRRAYPPGSSLSRWAAGDGWSIRRFDWPAVGDAGDRPRGSILFQGGRGDILEKYLESFAHWRNRGWNVTAFDWRGQGGSGRFLPDPRIGHASDFAPWIADLAAFWADWAPTAPGPRVAMGHSMGGHLILRGLVEGAIAPDAAVLIAPMLGLHSPFGWAALGERLARFLGGFGDSGRAAWRDNEIPGTKSPRQLLLTHDLPRYEDELWWKGEQPDLMLGPPSWSWVIQAFRSTRELRDDPRLARMSVPTLALIADADKLVSAKAAVATVRKLPDHRIVRFGKESAHEILREADPVRNRALGEIDLFLSSRAQPK